VKLTGPGGPVKPVMPPNFRIANEFVCGNPAAAHWPGTHPVRRLRLLASAEDPCPPKPHNPQAESFEGRAHMTAPTPAPCS
jgi:hypothetical protein